MNNFIINNTINFINKNGNYSELDLLKIKYGIEGIYLTITKTLIILLIGIIFNFITEVVLTLMFFNIIRFFAFGLHADKSWQCLILSIIQFNLLPYIFLNISINNIFIIIVSIISIISFLLFAPSDTIKRPLTNKKKRIIRKILSILVCIIFIVLAFYFSKLCAPILCALLIQSFMVNPASYKMLGLKYKNYKNKEVSG